MTTENQIPSISDILAQVRTQRESGAKTISADTQTRLRRAKTKAGQAKNSSDISERLIHNPPIRVPRAGGPSEIERFSNLSQIEELEREIQRLRLQLSAQKLSSAARDLFISRILSS